MQTRRKKFKKYFLAKHLSLFENEIFWLKKFEKFDFTPNILNIDYENLVLTLTHEGKKISNVNAPKNWLIQLKKILICLKKNNCHHSDIKPDNILVKNNKIKLIDFAQSTFITNLKKNIFYKKRIFYDDYAINRINLSINKNLVLSNDLRTMVIWDTKYQKFIEKKLNQNKNLKIIDKIKIKQNFYKEKFKNRIFWVDQFYNKNVSKKSEKLKNNIYVYILQSLNPVFKIKKMIFNQEKRIVDEKIFEFKKKVRKNKFSVVHIADNFEESKRNAIFLSKSSKNYPALYFTLTQSDYKNKKEFFSKLNKCKNLKYLILRNRVKENEDIDILTNDFFLFKRISDCHSYKLKNLNFISNSGDPVEENGIKVSNYIKVNNSKVFLDIRYVGDNYFDINWQKNIINKRKSFSDYYIVDKENKLYSLIYHIVFHKGYIDKKYLVELKKLFNNEINLNALKEKIEFFLIKKKYEVTRPNDLTIPLPYVMDKLLIDKEILNMKNQLNIRNYSGLNKMLLNFFKFQKILSFCKLELLIIIFKNQFFLIKTIIKKYIYRFFSIDV